MQEKQQQASAIPENISSKLTEINSRVYWLDRVFFTAEERVRKEKKRKEKKRKEKKRRMIDLMLIFSPFLSFYFSFYLSFLLQVRDTAATKICAVVRGYLVRRRFKLAKTSLQSYVLLFHFKFLIFIYIFSISKYYLPSPSLFILGIKKE